MKKLIYLVAAMLTAGVVVSCDDNEGTYGDLSVRPEISLTGFYSQTNPERKYTLEVDPSAPTDTTYEVPEMTAKFCVYKPVTIPADVDTFKLFVKTNSRWAASTPTRTGLMLMDASGNGDKEAVFRVTRGATTLRTRVMYFYTNDSSVMHKVIIDQLPRE